MDAKEFLKKSKLVPEYEKEGDVWLVQIDDLCKAMESYASEAPTQEEIEKEIGIHLETLPYAGGYPSDWRTTLSIHLSGFLSKAREPKEGCEHQFVEANNIEFTDGTEIEKGMVCVKCQAVKQPKNLVRPPNA